ncbi:MAG TPA: hypothetical protein VHF69_05320, partial [Candidatus Synoicihabitans sp.]|nr:hypothetical protein [Candidatus Synoicihabitans sp.]
MTRRLLIFAAAAIGLSLVALVLLPWWFGWALRTVGEPRGLRLGAYERIGYTRWAARDVVFTHEDVVVRLARVEADHPWRWWRGTPSEAGVVVTEWSVEVPPGDESEAPAHEFGWRSLHGVLMQVREGLGRWVPRAGFGAGAVRWPGQELRLASGRWDGVTLAVDDLAWREHVADVEIAWPEPRSVAMLTARSEAQRWRARAEFGEAEVTG